MVARHFSGRSRTARAWSLLVAAGSCLALVYGCATLTEPTLNICGNGIVESFEDCDVPTANGDPNAPACGKPGDLNQCRFVSGDTGCPVGFHAGEDDVCRTPTASFLDPGSARGTVLQLIDSGETTTAVFRNGTELDIVTLDASGAVSGTTTLPGLAEGLRQPQPLGAEALGDFDFRPNASDVEPLSRGRLVIPLQSRTPENLEVSASVNYLYEEDGVYLTEIQRAFEPDAEYPPASDANGPQLIPFPAARGTALVELGYLASVDQGLAICRVNPNLQVDCSSATIPSGPNYTLRVGEVTPYSVSLSDDQGNYYLASSVVPYGIRVGVSTFFGFGIDPNVTPGEEPQTTLYTFSNETLAPGCPVESCYEEVSAPSCVCAAEASCVNFCRLGVTPAAADTDPPVDLCDCASPCIADCSPSLRDTPTCTEQECPACFASGCKATIELQEILFATAAPGLYQHGADLAFVMEFSYLGESYIGTLYAHHTGTTSCPDLSAPQSCLKVDVQLPSMDSAFLVTEDSDLDATLGLEDLTGDGAVDYVFQSEVGAFPPQVLLSSPLQFVTAPLDRVLAAEDINGDGVADLLGSRGPLLVALLGGPTWPFVEVSFSVGALDKASPVEIVTADLDGDGFKDAVVRTAFGLPDLPCDARGGRLYVLFGGTSIEAPVSVGSGTCVTHMLTAKLAYQADGVDDVAFFRQPSDGPASGGALLGDPSRILTSPFFVDGLISRLFPAASVAPENHLAFVVVGELNEQDQAVLALTVEGGQLIKHPVEDAAGIPLTTGADSFVIAAATSSERLAMWREGQAHVLERSGDAETTFTYTEPTSLDHVKSAGGNRSILVGPKGGVDLGGPEFVFVSISDDGSVMNLGSELLSLDDIPCEDTLTRPYWLSTTEFFACGLIISTLAEDQTHAFGPLPYCFAAVEGSVEVESTDGTGYLSADLNRDGLFDRVEREGGRISLQNETCEFSTEPEIATKE